MTKYFLFFLILNINVYLQFIKQIKMEERLKPGRKTMQDKDKVKMVGCYLLAKEKAAINKKYGSLTKAVRLLVLTNLKIK